MSQFFSMSWDAGEAEALANEGRCVFRSPPCADADPFLHASDDGLAPLDGEGEDRRLHRRVAFRTRVSVFEVDDAGARTSHVACETLNLSKSGIGLLARRMFYRGRRMVIRVQLPGGRTRSLFGEVRYSRYADGGRYHVGVRFCPPPGSGAPRPGPPARSPGPPGGG